MNPQADNARLAGARAAAGEETEAVKRREWTKRIFTVWDIDNNGMLDESVTLCLHSLDLTAVTTHNSLLRCSLAKEFFQLYRVLDPNITRDASKKSFEMAGAMMGALDFDGLVCA